MTFINRYDELDKAFGGNHLSTEESRARRAKQTAERRQRRNTILLKSGALTALVVAAGVAGPPAVSQAKQGIREGARIVATNVEALGTVAEDGIVGAGDAIVGVVAEAKDQVGATVADVLGGQEKQTNGAYENVGVSPAYRQELGATAQAAAGSQVSPEAQR